MKQASNSHHLWSGITTDDSLMPDHKQSSVIEHQIVIQQSIRNQTGISWDQASNSHQLGSGIKWASNSHQLGSGIKTVISWDQASNRHQLGSGIKRASNSHQKASNSHQKTSNSHQRVMNYARKKTHKSTIIHSKCSMLKYKYNPGCFLYSIVALKTCLNKNVKSWVLLILFTSNVFNK